MEYVRRKKLFVNSQIQGSLLRRLCGFWLLYHVCLWHAMYLVSAVQQSPTVSVLVSYQQFLQTERLLPLLALATFPIVFWGMLRFSHRVAGPLVQLRNRLRDMASGNPASTIRFRKGDLMTEIQDAFNAYVAYRKALEAVTDDGTDSSTGEACPAVDVLNEAEGLKRDIENSVPASNEVVHSPR